MTPNWDKIETKIKRTEYILAYDEERPVDPARVAAHLDNLKKIYAFEGVLGMAEAGWWGMEPMSRECWDEDPCPKCHKPPTLIEDNKCYCYDCKIVF